MEASPRLDTTRAMRVHPGLHLLGHHNHHNTLAEVDHKPIVARTTRATRTNVSSMPYQGVQLSFVVLTLALTSPTPTSHSGLGLYNDRSPGITPLPSLPNPGGFRLNIVDYERGTERPGAAAPGTFNDASLESGQPGGFIVPESPRYGNMYNDGGPTVNPPWAGGFGTHQ